MWESVGLYVALSLGAVLIALVAMAAVYRSTRPEISEPVLIGWWDETRPAISVSPSHLGSEHLGKSPLVAFRLPGKPRVMLTKPLIISIQSRDSDYTYGPHVRPTAKGGRVCVDKATYHQLEEKLLQQQLNIESTAIGLRFAYPSAADVAFLFRDHPDMGVRAAAWIFLLTSLFAIGQTIITRVVGI